MVKVSDYPEEAYERIVNQELPDFGETPCVDGPPLSKRRIVIITTAGLHRREDKPFSMGIGEYRIIPDDTDMADLIMSHISNNFDRSGFQQDLNVVFPIDRLHELHRQGAIGSVASYHYSFMGATPPTVQEAVAQDLAGIMKKDGVDGAILVGV